MNEAEGVGTAGTAIRVDFKGDVKLILPGSAHRVWRRRVVWDTDVAHVCEGTATSVINASQLKLSDCA